MMFPKTDKLPGKYKNLDRFAARMLLMIYNDKRPKVPDWYFYEYNDNRWFFDALQIIIDKKFVGRDILPQRTYMGEEEGHVVYYYYLTFEGLWLANLIKRIPSDYYTEFVRDV